MFEFMDIVQEYLTGTGPGMRLSVNSVFVSPSDTSVFFVECRGAVDCQQLLQGVHYPVNRFELVPLENRSALLPTFGDDITLHEWVRLREGDIGYVVEVNDANEMIGVLRVPDLSGWLGKGKAKNVGDSHRHLLSTQELRTLLRSHASVSNHLFAGRFEIIQKKYRKCRVFEGGLEFVWIPRPRTKVVDHPDPQELLPFVQARENSRQLSSWFYSDATSEDERAVLRKKLHGELLASESFEWLTPSVLLRYSDVFSAHTVDVGDRVEVADDAPVEHHGEIGFVEKAGDDEIQVRSSASKELFTILRKHARRTFRPYDRVRVLRGPYAGQFGLVLAVEDRTVHVVGGTAGNVINVCSCKYVWNCADICLIDLFAHLFPSVRCEFLSRFQRLCCPLLGIQLETSSTFSAG